MKKQHQIVLEKADVRIRKRDRMARFVKDKTENISDPFGIGANIKMIAYFGLGFLAFLILIPILKLIL